MAAISENSKLNTLYIGENNLSSVKTELLAKAATYLETFCIGNIDITTKQAEAIFTAIAGNSELKVLDIERNNLSSVKPELLSKPTSKLEVLHISETSLTSPQAEEIFRLIDENSKMVMLNIADVDLSSLDLALFTRVKEKLEFFTNSH